MSFRAYIDNIKTNTGKSPEDFKNLVENKGFIKPRELVVKATQVTDWLKSDFDLRHEQAMAIYSALKGKKS